jgi:hypothetical protein
MKNHLRITRVSNSPLSLWRDVAAACSYATYFHTPEWADIFCRYTKGRLCPAPRTITFDDGVSILLPLSRRRLFGGVFQMFLSSPAGTFGGWISRDAVKPSHTQAMIDYMHAFDDIVWRENPYDPFTATFPIAGAADDFTQVIDLTQSDEALRKSASRAHAKALRKARREGVIIGEAQSLDDWKQHFRAYELSLVRWKKAGTEKKYVKPYAWDLFNIIYQKKSPLCKLWCARYKGVVAASVLCFYWNKHAVAWHGSALEEHFAVRPNNLLYQHMIDHARQAGFRWFDCNTPGGLKGVVEFKDNLGTQRLKSRVVDKASKKRKMFQKIKRYFT